MKRVIVACGTGIATSTVVCVKIKEALAAANIQAEVVQCKVAEIESKLATGADLVVTTTSYTSDKVPVIRALSFLTGIGQEADIKKIVDILK